MTFAFRILYPRNKCLTNKHLTFHQSTSHLIYQSDEFHWHFLNLYSMIQNYIWVTIIYFMLISLKNSDNTYTDIFFTLCVYFLLMQWLISLLSPHISKTLICLLWNNQFEYKMLVSRKNWEVSVPKI